MLKGVSIINWIANDYRMRISIEYLSYRLELFIPRSIPKLEPDYLFLDLDVIQAALRADRDVVMFAKFVAS